jgi:hypothetical protein
MKERYISLQEAAEKLGVARGTLHYYLEKLEIKRTRFPLDKHVYILFADYERIVTLRQEAVERNEGSTDPKRPAIKTAA